MPALATLILALLVACGRANFEPIDAALVDARSPIVARFEAESAQITPLFQVEPDPTAFGGQYLIDGNMMGITGTGDAVYTLTLPQVGTFWLWARTRATGQSDDSVFVQVDGGADFVYFTVDCVFQNPWRWVVVTIPHNCPGPGIPQPFDFSAGLHTLRLHSREGGASIDAIAIVDDPAFVVTD